MVIIDCAKTCWSCSKNTMRRWKKFKGWYHCTCGATWTKMPNLNYSMLQLLNHKELPGVTTRRGIYG